MMRRSNPFDEIERMFERMAKQFDDLGHQWDSGGMRSWGAGGDAGVSVDVAEYDDEIVVTADLPGFEKDEIDVSVTEHGVAIGAERHLDTREGEGGAYLRRERRSESVRRTIRLPESVDDEGAEAAYNNGVLTVTLPKMTVEEPDEESRHIDIE